MSKPSKTHYYSASFSEGDLDLILGLDPEVNPNEDLEAQLLKLVRYVNTVQSIVDDAVTSW